MAPGAHLDDAMPTSPDPTPATSTPTIVVTRRGGRSTMVIAGPGPVRPDRLRRAISKVRGHESKVVVLDLRHAAMLTPAVVSELTAFALGVESRTGQDLVILQAPLRSLPLREPDAPRSDAPLPADPDLILHLWRDACGSPGPLAFVDEAALVGAICERLHGGDVDRRMPIAAVVAITWAAGLTECMADALRELGVLRRILAIDTASGPTTIAGLRDEVMDECTRAVALHAIALTEELTLVDPLTGLWNRRALEQRLPVALTQARRDGSDLSVAMIDIDGLKETNNLVGHDAGDRLLRDFAGVLAGCLRAGDDLYRVGGDEFVLVLPRATASTAGEILDRGLSRTSSFSWGIATYPDDGDRSAELINRADGRLLSHRAVRAAPSVARSP